MVDDDIEDDSSGSVDRPWSWRRRLATAVAAVLALVAGLAWLSRDRIANDVITRELARQGLNATYRIEHLGPRLQVLSHVVVGDPARPDLTVERVEIALVPRFGAPGIGRVKLVRPRLYGSYRSGKLSFGSLDKILFEGPRRTPFRLPDIDLALDDGRALIESDFGRIGIKASGEGRLRNGFAGEVAAVAPGLAVSGCKVQRATLYGTLRVAAERPRFLGPLRLAGLACPDKAASMGYAAAQLDLTFDQPLDGLDARLGLRAGNMAYGTTLAGGIAGTASATWRKHALTARYDVALARLSASEARAGIARAEGSLRADGRFARIEAEGTLHARDLDAGSGPGAWLGRAQGALAGTLAEPLVKRLRGAIARQGSTSSLLAHYMLRRNADGTAITVPDATVKTGNGEPLIALSRMQMTLGPGGPRVVAGYVATGGPDMPRIAGNVRTNGRDIVLRLAMAEYASGNAQLEIPGLVVVQAANGAFGFAGRAIVSGNLPGGRAENLSLPVDGSWTVRSGLALWRGCTPVAFDRLQIANLTLERRGLTLCPPRGLAALRMGQGGMRFAAGAPALNVAGRLGTTPIRIASGPIGFAVPGNLSARALAVELGPSATASHFVIARLDARIGTGVAGHFAGSEMRLAAVPLDLTDASGAWRFGNGRLTIDQASFTVRDRAAARRFEPLVAQGASLGLADNRIVAAARLLDPASQRLILIADIRHDLATGRGSADLHVPGIAFDSRLQPDTLTPLALGVVANARGTVRGKGRIDWNPLTTSSSGEFSSDALDFAAAFGPVKGLDGTVRFIDLLGLVSAPHQQLHVASINPGIEVTDGTIDFSLLPESRLALHGAQWPFLGGTLDLAPTTMTLGVAETRRYTLNITGLNGARLVEQMGLANVSLVGIFDGSIPLVFDENGGRIDLGQLRSRPPGGNLSYVGALTYKDLSPMANFAFQTLKSLDYKEMGVELEGPLQGEIITRLKFSGIRQGATARKNFLTRRIARLPIVFNVNIKAPFFQIVTSLRSMYDPAYVRDPRTLGLIDAKGRPIAPAPPGVQPSESVSAP